MGPLDSFLNGAGLEKRKGRFTAERFPAALAGEGPVGNAEPPSVFETAVASTAWMIGIARTAPKAGADALRRTGVVLVSITRAGNCYWRALLHIRSVKACPENC
jgi:hypothetical protein